MYNKDNELKQLLKKAKNNGAFDKEEIIQIDKFLTDLNDISTPQKFDIKKYNKIFAEILQWLVVSEKVIKDIIDLCTYRK